MQRILVWLRRAVLRTHLRHPSVQLSRVARDITQPSIVMLVVITARKYCLICVGHPR